MVNITILKIMIKTALVPFSYGKIVRMNKKKLSILAGALLGLGLTALAAQAAYQIGEVKKARRMADIRAYFSQFGDIQVVYINEFEGDHEFSGGVALTDGRQFDFVYDQGDIIAQEVVV
ncbi:DUF4651 domain-containing protein [Streptococcus hyovaginalis]|uniref:DUF4651 domain-containing protein n=2 Tax=Streptococcus hyovaginalis TaxID=149015 RepID=UPI000408EFDD